MRSPEDMRDLAATLVLVRHWRALGHALTLAAERVSEHTDPRRLPEPVVVQQLLRPGRQVGVRHSYDPVRYSRYSSAGHGYDTL